MMIRLNYTQKKKGKDRCKSSMFFPPLGSPGRNEKILCFFFFTDVLGKLWSYTKDVTASFFTLFPSLPLNILPCGRHHDWRRISKVSLQPWSSPANILHWALLAPPLQTCLCPGNLGSHIPGQHSTGPWESREAWMGWTLNYSKGSHVDLHMAVCSLPTSEPRSLHDRNNYIYQM